MSLHPQQNPLYIHNIEYLYGKDFTCANEKTDEQGVNQPKSARHVTFTLEGLATCLVLGAYHMEPRHCSDSQSEQKL